MSSIKLLPVAVNEVREAARQRILYYCEEMQKQYAHTLGADSDVEHNFVPIDLMQMELDGRANAKSTWKETKSMDDTAFIDLIATKRDSYLPMNIVIEVSLVLYVKTLICSFRNSFSCYYRPTPEVANRF